MKSFATGEIGLCAGFAQEECQSGQVSELLCPVQLSIAKIPRGDVVGEDVLESRGHSRRRILATILLVCAEDRLQTKANAPILWAEKTNGIAWNYNLTHKK